MTASHNIDRSSSFNESGKESNVIQSQVSIVIKIKIIK